MKTKKFKTIQKEAQKKILGGYNTEMGICIIDGEYVDWPCNQACPNGRMPLCMS